MRFVKQTYYVGKYSSLINPGLSTLKTPVHFDFQGTSNVIDFV